MKKDGSCSYCIRVSNGYDRAGRQVLVNRTYTPPPGMTGKKLERELKRQADAFEQQVRNGISLEASMKMDDLIERWFTEYAEKRLKAKTVYNYRRLVPRISAGLGQLKVCQVKPSHLMAFYSNLEEQGVREDSTYTATPALLELLPHGQRGEIAKAASIGEDTMRNVHRGANVSQNTAEKVSRVAGLPLSKAFTEHAREGGRLNGNTVQHYHRMLSSVFTKAVQWGLVPENPCKRAEAPKAEEIDVQALEELDVARLLQALQDALIFILCCLAMVLTWIIPAGTFERVTEGTLTKVVAGTFQHVDSSPQTPWAMLQAIYQGFINSAGTIFLIFFCGASVAMVEESHALSDFFTWLARKLKGKEMLAIAILMYGLGLGNAAGAFANIGVALMPIGIVMSNAIGGDAFLAFLIIYYGLQSGFSIGFANPSILGVAQTMAEIPIFSGTNVRVVCCLANITFLYIVTMLYYRRIRKDPTKSLNYGSDFHSAFEISSDKVDSKMTKRQILTAAVFLLGVVLCVGLTIACKWNAKKIASYFFGMMIVIGLVSGFSMNEISDKFIKGCKPMIYASFITGLASAIAVILNQGKVLDTIVYALSIPLNQVGAVVGAGLMVVVNVIVNIFIPSGSGQAAVMIPLMTPIADLVGITRQVAVQAFQFGDGLCNLLTPLNGPMMGCLAMVGISFPKYIKWAFKYLMMNIGAAIVITMVLQAVGWVGF